MWTLVLVAIVVVCLVAILLPVFGARRPWEGAPTSELDQLFARKARILRAIKDVDHEHEAGLLSDDDWRETRQEYLDEAVRLNREIADRTGVDATAAEGAR
jgi:hypothetical protein